MGDGIISKIIVLLLWGLFWVVAFPLMIVLEAAKPSKNDQ